MRIDSFTTLRLPAAPPTALQAGAPGTRAATVTTGAAAGNTAAASASPQTLHLIRLTLDSDLYAYTGCRDLVDHSRLPAGRTFRLKPCTPFAQFKGMVEDELGVPAAQQRYWLWQARENGTCR